MSRGLVRIEKEARKTISYLSEHAMLLSRGARSDTIPILEILCRDVKATHSSSVAPVDPERIFYLESRGLPESSGDSDDRGRKFLSAHGSAPRSHSWPAPRDVLYPPSRRPGGTGLLDQLEGGRTPDLARALLSPTSRSERIGVFDSKLR